MDISDISDIPLDISSVHGDAGVLGQSGRERGRLRHALVFDNIVHKVCLC
jgi:hypothetical protein